MWYVAATFFLIAGLVWGFTGSAIGFALIVLALAAAVLGMRETR